MPLWCQRLRTLMPLVSMDPDWEPIVLPGRTLNGGLLGAGPP